MWCRTARSSPHKEDDDGQEGMPSHAEEQSRRADRRAESPLILTGNVSYRFHLRQQRQPLKNGTTTASPSRKRPRRRVDEEDGNDNECCLADPDASIVGFVLHDDTRNEDFILSVPQHLQTLLGQAASKRLRVQVSADSIIDLRHPASLSAASHDEVKAGGIRGLVETSNLQLLSTSNVSDNEGPRSFLSLTQVRQVEMMDRVVIGDTSATGSSTTTERWDVKATVRAVSPIDTSDQSDPYCLVELLDADALCSGVAILRRKALVHHQSIVPGGTLFLRGARRRPWIVHETIRVTGDKLPRPPPQVFLADKPHQVVWPSFAAAPRPTIGEASTTHRKSSACPTTVSGEVTRIRTIKVPKDASSSVDEHLHTIELVDSATVDPSASRYITLFVTYFPLPTGLLLSIRPGARIVATNLRPMTLAGSHCYCATLRSHISLVSFGTNMCRPLSASEIELATHPCCPPRARLSYDEHWARRSVARMVDPWRAPPTKSGETTIPPSRRPPCPDSKEVAKAYLQLTWTATGKPTCHDAAQRDPNAEFFYGDCEGELSHSESAVRMPLKVNEVYDVAIRALHKILDNHVKSASSCSFGSMGSIHRSGRDLLPGFEDETRVVVVERARPVIFGLASSVKTTTGVAQAVVSCQEGVSIPCAIRLPANLSVGNSLFILATIQSFVASFFCLGVCESSNIPRPVDGYPLHELGASADAFGACRILVVQNVAFLVSLRLECSDEFVFGSDHWKETWNDKKAPATTRTDATTIQECIVGPASRETKFFFGLLTSKSPRVFKATNGVYKGCTLSLAHIPSGARDLRVDSVSTLQSIDLKLSIPVDDSMLVQLRRRLVSTLGLGLPDIQLIVACIWWQMALQAPLLLDGGWDELVSSTSTVAESTGVVVKAPIRAAHLDPARGYVRFACQLEDLELSSIHLRPCVSSLSSGCAGDCALSVDFLTKKRILPGDLSSRAKRRLGSKAQRGQYSFGELHNPALCECAGIPSSTIVDIFRDLTADLASKSRARVAPSLVREIRSAKLLSVSYCQVIAECPLCFKSLVAPNAASGLHGRVPQNGSTLLRCPGQCPPSVPSIKWECSGTLDDGTGQAKLYAEREAALALLKMSATNVRDVEAAAVSRAGGLVYSRGLPPRSDLVVALDSARHRSLQKLHDEWAMGRHRQHPNRSPRTRITEDDLLNCLNVYDRGDFVLQRHCRCSREPTRDLVYYVRCKPFSDDVLRRGILNVSEIDVLRPGIGGGRATVSKHVATYALPPLKVVLVDVASPVAPCNGKPGGF